MDEEHWDFVRTLESSPGIKQSEKERLREQFNDNYSQKLDKLNMITEMNPVDYSVERGLLILPKDELDRIDA